MKILILDYEPHTTMEDLPPSVYKTVARCDLVFMRPRPNECYVWKDAIGIAHKVLDDNLMVCLIVARLDVDKGGYVESPASHS